MTQTFEKNWNFSQKSMPEVVRILKEHAHHFMDFQPASEEQDLKQATDYIIQFKGGTIAIRVRRADCRYRDLTIRAVSGSGETEIDKIIRGFADFYFYGWTTTSQEILEYLLVDIQKLRESGLLESQRKHVKMNTNGYTGFIVISPFALIAADALLDYNLGQGYLWGSQ